MNAARATLLAVVLAAIRTPSAESQTRMGVRPNSGAAFAVEALGASVGSLIGIGIVALSQGILAALGSRVAARAFRGAG